jgi:hypothetical protein
VKYQNTNPINIKGIVSRKKKGIIGRKKSMLPVKDAMIKYKAVQLSSRKFDSALTVRGVYKDSLVNIVTKL